MYIRVYHQYEPPKVISEPLAPTDTAIVQPPAKNPPWYDDVVAILEKLEWFVLFESRDHYRVVASCTTSEEADYIVELLNDRPRHPERP